MKLIFTTLIYFLASTSYAEIYKCTPTVGTTDLYYIAALTPGSAQRGGLFFINSNGVSEYQRGKLITDRSLNEKDPHEPILLKYDPLVHVDWTKEEECYAFVTPFVFLEIRTSKSGDHGSTYQIVPNIVVNPKVKKCDRPMIKPAPPQPAICELL